MSVQRWDIERGAPAWVASKGEFVKHADHARIVAEAAAEARAAERRHWEARFRNAEQAHAAALAKQKAQCIEHQANAVAAEREKHAAALAAMPKYAEGVVNGWRQAAAGEVPGLVVPAAPRTLTRDGWWPFGSFVDYDFPLEFDGEGEDGLPIWERPDKSRLAPRTLTADDPEPAVGSVVLLAVGNEAVQRSALGWQGYAMHTMQWAEMFRFGPVTLIHDGEDR